MALKAFQKDAAKYVHEWLEEARLCTLLLKNQEEHDSLVLEKLKKQFKKIHPYEVSVAAGQFMQIIGFFMRKNNLPNELLEKSF